MKYKIATFIIVITSTFSFLGVSCGLPHNGPESKRCEPDWYGDRPISKSSIFGVGLGETSNRRVAKDLSWSSAAGDVNNQIQSRVIIETVQIFNELSKGINNEKVRDFQDGIESNLYSKTDRTLEGTISKKFADCVSNGVWSAYTLVEFDFKKWKKSVLKTIIDEEMEQADEEIQAQKDDFYERMGIK